MSQNNEKKVINIEAPGFQFLFETIQGKKLTSFKDIKEMFESMYNCIVKTYTDLHNLNNLLNSNKKGKAKEMKDILIKYKEEIREGTSSTED